MSKKQARELGLMRSFPCPICGESMRVKSTRLETDLIRSSWLLCQNVHCGAGFHAFTTIERMTSPSGMEHNLNIPTSFKNPNPKHKVSEEQPELPLFAVTTEEPNNETEQ